MEACHAMGMTTWQTLRRIVIPEALTVAFPSLINSFILEQISKYVEKRLAIPNDAPDIEELEFKRNQPAVG